MLLFACGQGPEGESTSAEQSSDLRVVCPRGDSLCSGVCRNTRSDAANCGACGHACAPGSSCVNGACTCPAGEALCAGVCRNLENDRANCGACGNACSSAVTATCSAGKCVSTCPAGTPTLCGNHCVNLASDNANCGACGTTCASTCSAGACTPTVVLFGGVNTSNVISNQTWVFNGSTWTSPTIANPPPARVFASMATLGNEVVLFGGGNGSITGVFNDTWEFNGATWTKLSIANPPPPRQRAMMATLGGEIVLFGGSDANANALSDTWTFNGSSWTQVSVTNGPLPTFSGAMAANGNTQVMLFGGLNPTPNFGIPNNLWVFSGNAWTNFGTTPMDPVENGMMTNLLAQTVFFGGEDFNGVLPNATWMLDSTIFNQVTSPVSPSPPGRTNAAMASLANQTVVLFGGSGATGVLGDTWTFNGTTWTQAPISGPPPLTAASMAALPFL